jgi:hypothetical protein
LAQEKPLFPLVYSLPHTQKAAMTPPSTAEQSSIGVVPTGASSYESGLQLRWKTWRGERNVHIPLVDVAGEDIQLMLEDYDQGTRTTLPNYRTAVDLIRYIKDSEGFILALPSPRAYLGNEQLEPEPEDLAADPDVNLSRLLEQVLNYKEKTRGKKVKGVAVVITKYDLLAPYAVSMGMDLYTAGGIDRFMEVCFPDTNMQLKYLKDKGLVKFFPSHVQVLRGEDGSVVTWPNSSPKIEVNPNTRKPKYSEESYMALFDYLEQFAN